MVLTYITKFGLYSRSTRLSVLRFVNLRLNYFYILQVLHVHELIKFASNDDNMFKYYIVGRLKKHLTPVSNILVIIKVGKSG